MRNLLAFILLALLISPALAAAPNVVVILTDDQGYGDLSAHGNPILKTPNLDKMHDASIRLTNFHVSPVCTPTRSELMTGQYALKNAGMVPSGRNILREESLTMAQVFAHSGYATGLFGKWHLGDTYPARPCDKGFQKVVQHRGWGLVSEIEYNNDYHCTRYIEDGKTKFSDKYCANLWFDAASDFITECVKKDEPFFAYISLNTPHGPFHAPPEDREIYKKRVKGQNLANFYGMIKNIDDNIARFDEKLKALKIYDNTLVVFMNDNGTSRGDKIYNAGMRGKKGSAYDGGHRAICFMRLPKGTIGEPREIKTAAQITDLLPTFIDLFSLKNPRKDWQFDGSSLRKPLLEEKEIADRTFVVQFGTRTVPQKFAKSCVVSGDWRLVGENELYNLAVDPGQKKNIAKETPKKIAELQKIYDAYWDDVKPYLADVVHIPVGVAGQGATLLTCNNWLEVDCDNQRRVAQGEGGPKGGAYCIDVKKAGTYKVELSRWPFFLDRKLTIAGPAKTIGDCDLVAGKAIPIASGSLQLGGGAVLTEKSMKDATSIAFEVKLRRGKQKLQGWFSDANGKDLCGAYYVQISLLNP